MQNIQMAMTLLATLLLCAISRPADADRIDFEIGYQRLDPVTSVTTATNTVQISTQGEDNNTPFVAQVGTTPKDGFERVVDGVVMGDMPFGGDPGNYFLTDGAGKENNFLIDFSRPVMDFSIDVYDYVGDGGAAPGDSMTLRAFADAARTNELATDSYTVPRPKPSDGLTVTLSVAPGTSISAITLDFSTFDRGTGVDNLQFTSLVPEPSSLFLSIIGLLTFGLIGASRRRNIR